MGQIWPGLPGPLMSLTPFLPPLKICSELHFSAQNASSTTIRLSTGQPITTHQMTRGILGAPPGAGPTPPRKRSNTAVREPEEDESARKRLKNIWKSEKKPETLGRLSRRLPFSSLTSRPRLSTLTRPRLPLVSVRFSKFICLRS